MFRVQAENLENRHVTSPGRQTVERFLEIIVCTKLGLLWADA